MHFETTRVVVPNIDIMIMKYFISHEVNEKVNQCFKVLCLDISSCPASSTIRLGDLDFHLIFDLRP